MKIFSKSEIKFEYKMNSPLYLYILSALFFFSCEQGIDDLCNELICDLFCESGYVLDENNCETCECIDYRDKYIGEWEFTKYWNVTHPYNPNEGDQIWVGEITYGDANNTLFVPHAQVPENNQYEYCYCYEFEINSLGEINQDSYDADNFNYFFEGYINNDSLYYSYSEGSPFSSTSVTIYGYKIN